MRYHRRFTFILMLSSGLFFQTDAQVMVYGFEPYMALPDELKECSGLIDLGDNIFIGLNDSGNPPELFKFNAQAPGKTMKISIPGVDNKDWEELASDDYFLYIGDTGNNAGNRKDLMIYKVPRQHLFSDALQKPEAIRFRYEDQKKFKPSNKHNFDCEAMISLGDSLYLFTKNRGNGQTDCYACPKTPGDYVLKKIGTYDAKGLITGASFYTDGNQRQLALIGYSFEDEGYHPFIIHFENFRGNDFFGGQTRKIDFDGSLQTETINFTDRNSVLISNEAEHDDPGYMYRVYLNEL